MPDLCSIPAFFWNNNTSRIMRPAKCTCYVLHFFITGIRIRDKVALKPFQKLHGNVSVTRSRIMEERSFDFFTGSTSDHPHKGVAAGFFSIFLITLDPCLVHVEHLTFHKFLMDPVIHRRQPFFATADHPVGHVISGQYQS